MDNIRSIAIPPLTDDLVRVLIDAETIQRRVAELAQQINRDYADIKEPLILVGVLKGSFIYLADLSRKLTVPHVIDFIAVSSYGKGTVTSGNVRLLMDTRENLEGHHVLIVEDILDSGYTLDYLVRKLQGARNQERQDNCSSRKAGQTCRSCEDRLLRILDS